MMQLNFSTKILQAGLVVMVIGSVYFSVVSVVSGAEGVNRQIPFHGELVDEKGKPLNGEFNMTFAIYDAPTGGTTLWSGVYTSDNGNPVDVEDGEFRVLLGSGTGNEFDSELFIDDTNYLGITVESDDEMTPRERMGASPYAINSDMLDGLHSSSFLRSNSVIGINDSTSTSLFTLTQTGTGDFMHMYDGAGDSLSYLNNSGHLYMSSIEAWNDAETNFFAGALDVQSPDDSFFEGNIVVADGSGMVFGSGNGIALSQDMSMPSDLLFTPVGESDGGDVRIVVPNALSIHANMSRADTGSEQPAIEMGADGLMRIFNLSNEPADDTRLELSFTNGTEITDGGLLVSDGGLAVTGGGITSEFGVEITDLGSTLKINSLAGNGNPDIAVDNNGIIVLSGTSDERFKKSIVTLDNALNTVLRLRGVRYEWKDKERFGAQEEIGFIAQEVQEVIPEVVRDSGEYLSLNTKNIVAVVVEAVKELHTKVEEYFSRTERLEREVESLRREIEIMKNGGVDARVEQESPCTTCDVVPEEIVETVVETEVEPEVVLEPEAEPEPVPVTEVIEEIQL